LCLLGLGLIVEHQLHENDAWRQARFRVYRLLNSLAPRAPIPANTVLVLIEDTEYWTGELAGRAPLKRSYLARLLRKLNDANPAVIAVDIDLRSPLPEGEPIEHPDYAPERNEFVAALAEVAAQRPVVLSSTVRRNSDGTYSRERAVYDSPERPAGVFHGYIELPFDTRLVPLSLTLAGGAQLDSFSQAIVRAFRPQIIERVEADNHSSFPYGSYIPEEEYKEFKLTAGKVLETSAQELKKRVANRIVLIGGEWHALAYGRGPRIDLHETPLGKTPGVFVHANYVEALLERRVFPPASPSAIHLICVLLSVGVAVGLAGAGHVASRLGVIIGVGSLFLAFNYFLLHNAGTYCDFLVPLILLVAHPLAEEVLHWRGLAQGTTG
jgi:CHASE2 domain-containing sensor protein